MKDFLGGVLVWAAIACGIYAADPPSAEHFLTRWYLGSVVDYLPRAALERRNIYYHSWLTFSPQPGYQWVSYVDGHPNVFDGVTWESDQQHPTYKHVLSSRTKDNWIPDSGYVWTDDGRQSGRRFPFGIQSGGTPPAEFVKWAPELPHSKYPHVKSAEREGYWTPGPGYQFTSKKVINEVVWYSGATFPGRPHLLSAATEGQWVPEPGYVTRQNANGANEVWTPGIPYPTDSNIISAAMIGQWEAKPGYRMVEGPGGALRAVTAAPAVGTYQPSPSTPAPSELTTGQMLLGGAALLGCYFWDACYKFVKGQAEDAAAKAAIEALTRRK